LEQHIAPPKFLLCFRFINLHIPPLLQSL
jgi:hypothetical protein